MIFLSAKSIAVKMDQDRVWVSEKKILLCDGIGSFEGSGDAADIVIECLKSAENNAEVMSYINEAHLDILDKKVLGGTTMLSAIVAKDCLKVIMAYLGNGSIYHFNGDLFDKPDTYTDLNKANRYINYLLPHVDKNGSLAKHISNVSTVYELEPTFLELSLTGLYGDVILMFTDGISTLEEDMIIADDQSRIWRNQSENVNSILEHWDLWMKSNCSDINKEKVDKFLEEELTRLKENKKLDDDASIGLIMTKKVVDYYQTKYHAC